MAKRRWTLVVVPHGSEPSRIVEVSYNVLRAVAAAVGGVVVLGLLAGYATISQRDARIRVLANLEPIDPQVQAAGIGGPGSSDMSLRGVTGLARRSAEVRVDLGA